MLKYAHCELNPLPGDRIVKEEMSTEIKSIFPTNSVADAWKMMMKEGRIILVIVDKDKHPIGLVDRQGLLEALINLPHSVS